MPIAKAGSEGKSFDPVSAGVHQGVCYSVIDLGTQTPSNPAYMAARKVQIGWEIPGELVQTDDGPKPRVIGKEYTLSLGKKATLRAALQSWRGRPFTEEELKGFELSKLLGANCLINVIHKTSDDGSKTYARIEGLMPLPKGMPVLKPLAPTLTFDLPKTGPIVLLEAIPEWIKEKIMKSEEWVAQVSGGKAITETKKLEAGADPAIVGELNKEDVPF
jgi:hypothetical protein